MSLAEPRQPLRRLLPLYVVVFMGFVGYSLMITATLLSNAADPAAQGRAMGNSQAIQVGAEALSGLAAGLLAALIVRLPLIVLGGVSVFGAILVALLL